MQNSRKNFWFLLSLFGESFKQAWGALVNNKLRTSLSLLGITIGIFCIITVFSLVNALEKGIEDGINDLGNNTVFIQKWPWIGGNNYPWWKFVNRPEPSLQDYNNLRNMVENADFIAFISENQGKIEFINNNLEGVTVSSITENYHDIKKINLSSGRYFTPNEFLSGAPLVVLGHDVAQALFFTENPIGKTVKINGRKLEVIGVIEKEGNSIFGNSLDLNCLIPVNLGRTLFNIKNRGYILVKGKEGVLLENLIGELQIKMRIIRRLSQGQDDDFALNEPSLISSGLEGVLRVTNIVGFIIGGFSMLVGGFSIANIMFVSVKERTAQIGIQKALGAKKSFILSQFLFESVALCAIGGAIGLILVFVVTLGVQILLDISVLLTPLGALVGLFFSMFTGVVAGYFPAAQAADLDPVEAMRAN
ncbi:MAG: ABC transporter permease [Luteibaculaceae bacterium]